MCGIVALLAAAARAEASVSKVEDALTTVEHRGPEGRRVVGYGPCALGAAQMFFRGRHGTAQPLENEDATLALVCNGEITNARELRGRLRGAHHFAGDSDCEVILHAYEERGPGVATLLEGQYAFVLWDSRNRRLVAARDPFGICPLYYREAEGSWWFGSEAKAVTSSAHSVELDVRGMLEAVALYGPTPPRTCLLGVGQLPPGHTAVIEACGRMSLRPRSTQRWAGSQPGEGLPAVLDTAVKRRLTGTSAPAVYLSGGVDSALIAAITARHLPDVVALSLQFDDPAYDESRYQERVVSHLAVDHRPLRVTEADLIEGLADTVAHAESPLTRSAAVPMLLLSRHARANGFRCVLSAEGADELFAGYPVFAGRRASVTAKAQEAARLVALFADHGEAADVLSSIQEYDAGGSLTAAQHVEVETKLSRYLLAAQGDRTSMANAVEQRFPFLDEQVAAFAAQLPEASLLSEDGGKRPIRDAAASMLPREVALRPKQGYLAPDAAFIREHRRNPERWESLLAEPVLRDCGYFDIALVNGLLAAAADPSRPIDRALQAGFLLVLTTQLLHASMARRAA